MGVVVSGKRVMQRGGGKEEEEEEEEEKKRRLWGGRMHGEGQGGIGEWKTVLTDLRFEKKLRIRWLVDDDLSLGYKIANTCGYWGMGVGVWG
ncbi:hypothetical protein M0804_012116 [Polistes exclamans]|nr:hypothetical protein M0804_012116 [Polistes exclamans]